MAKVVDAQNSWSGGMNDRLNPESLATNAYASGKNLEIRNGEAATRRGSVKISTFQDSLTLQGATVFHAPFDDQRPESIIIVRGGQVWRQNIPQPAVKMSLPAGVALSTTEIIRFVQGLNYLYMLRGDDKQVLRWSGYTSDDWETISDPVAGDKFPNSSRGAFAYTRIWVVTGNDDLNASDSGSEAFDLTLRSYEIDVGEAGKITAVLSFVDGSLVVLKETASHWLGNANGDLTGLSRQIIDPRNGCIAGDTAVQIGRDIFFLSRDGVRTIALTEQNKAQMQDVTLTFNIPGIVDRINWQNAADAQAIQFDNYYLLAVPFDSATVNDTILAYDLIAKAWVGYWQGVECEKLLSSTRNNVHYAYALNSNGDVTQLLTGLYEDGVPKDPAYLDFTATAGEDVDCSDIGAATDLDLYTDGVVVFDMLLDASTGNGNILILSGGLTSFDVFLDSSDFINARMIDAGQKWRFRSDLTSYVNTGWIRVAIQHDGTVPHLWVNGDELSVNYITPSTDKTKWLADLVDPLTFKLGNTAPFKGGLRNVAIYREPAARTYFCMIPLNEGSGSVAKDAQTDTECSIANVAWVAASTPSDISYELKTRGFLWQSPAQLKTLETTELTISHRAPLFDFDVENEKPFTDSSLIASGTYSNTAYDIHGVDDWAETGVDFATAGRENYAPIFWTTAGIQLEDLSSNSYNVKPDLEQEHVEKVHSGLPCNSAQFKLSCSQGTINLRQIVSVADAHVFGLKSEE